MFCDIIEGRSPVSIVYEDDKIIVFPTIEPVNASHMLIVPKIHAPYLADVDEETTLHIIKIAREVSEAIRKSKYQCEGINWFLADGEAAEQEVFHFHFHVYPRFKGDGFGFKYDRSKNFIRTTRQDLDYIANEIKNLLQINSKEHFTSNTPKKL
ncbi:MAG TPA: HIT family protein [Ignavibacteria bacterium]|nr:HIT family protein [Ignavibacteria bacterium]